MKYANSFIFEVPTKIQYGIGAARHLADALHELKASRVLLVTDKGIEQSGLLAGIVDQLARDA